MTASLGVIYTGLWNKFYKQLGKCSVINYIRGLPATMPDDTISLTNEYLFFSEMKKHSKPPWATNVLSSFEKCVWGFNGLGKSGVKWRVYQCSQGVCSLQVLLPAAWGPCPCLRCLRRWQGSLSRHWWAIFLSSAPSPAGAGHPQVRAAFCSQQAHFLC